MTTLRNISDLTGRALLAAIFLISGVSKISTYAATAGYMASAGVPTVLLPAVIALEIGGSVAIILGWQTRITALALAVFSVVAGALFHNHWQDQVQFIMFLKNLAMAGGFIVLAVNGAGALSLDSRRKAHAE